MQVTLRDVAKAAQVHYGTVSHVLNGSNSNTRVSAETRQRIIEAAERLGYQPNRVAQQLRTRRSNVIGLLSGALENMFFARLVSLCAAILEEEGYELVLAMRRKDAPNDLHLLNTLNSRRPDGLLIWNEENTELHERVQRPDMTCTVTIGGTPIPGRDFVYGNLRTGVNEALNHMKAQGCKKIGYITPSVAIGREGDTRNQFYRQWINEQGHEARVFVFEGSAYDVAGAAQCAQQIAACSDIPDGLFCFNDMIAIGALFGLRKSGLLVPDDVALVGCDDLPLTAEMEVPLSSVAYPLEEMLRNAVHLLLERIRQSRMPDAVQSPLHEVSLPTTLQIRASSIRA